MKMLVLVTHDSCVFTVRLISSIKLNQPVCECELQSLMGVVVRPLIVSICGAMTSYHRQMERERDIST